MPRADDVAEGDALGARDEDAVAVPVHDLEALEQQVVEVRGEHAALAVRRVAAGVAGAPGAAGRWWRRRSRRAGGPAARGSRARGSRRTRSGAWRRPPRRSPRSRWRRRRARRSCRPRRTAAPRSRPRCGSPGRRGRKPSSPAVSAPSQANTDGSQVLAPGVALARDLRAVALAEQLAELLRRSSASLGTHEGAEPIRAEADRREVARGARLDLLVEALARVGEDVEGELDARLRRLGDALRARLVVDAREVLRGDARRVQHQHVGDRVLLGERAARDRGLVGEARCRSSRAPPGPRRRRTPSRSSRSP